ncbi:MAG: 2-oxoacid:acceptor oxidoreductase subunit alpha [Bdellovibrionales bacterium CG10_big_fil_rev_8_21_14_0_10_45_34]|nr:MAG: 2-oxoacid:acceptor oxidoreductase subunit alpha [Bdellovibrionales bacterium CG10_big_fil_rev_8_21_14_0_10_45_34]
MNANNFVLTVATVNGSGSQSSNLILLKTLFRLGVPVGGKNLFPSNIAGLPTWFTIRAHPLGFTARRGGNDITVAMNPDTLIQDIQEAAPGGYFFYNSDLKFDSALLRVDLTNIGIPFRSLVDGVTDAIKLKKLLANMIYVGVLSELFKIPDAVLASVVKDQFRGKKDSVVEVNQKTIEVGRTYAKETLNFSFPYVIEETQANDKKMIVDGNTMAALGSVWGGCSFVSWYPITPSSSLAEGFTHYANKMRLSDDGKKAFAVVQAEDELAAIGMVLGASWAGARAMTTTSGPGISLMSEFVGYSYFAEIPAVIWNIQRVGPSTGLPTRTMQGDLLSTYSLSHGDTKHVMLIPANPTECFEFAKTAFDLAEELQTTIFVMSDLDLGMNLWVCDEPNLSEEPLKRGKVLSKDDPRIAQFFRYEDVDSDGIPYRTLPGTAHPKASYFTRGSGHNEKGQYTENQEAYVRIVDRLNRKYETARTRVPTAEVSFHSLGSATSDSTANHQSDSSLNVKTLTSKISVEKYSESGEEPTTRAELSGIRGETGNHFGDEQKQLAIVAFGSTDIAMPEIISLLNERGASVSYMRIRAVPFGSEVKDFLSSHTRIFVVEQNRDGQMTKILGMEFPSFAERVVPVLSYDGLPIDSNVIAQKIIGFVERQGDMALKTSL